MRIIIKINLFDLLYLITDMFYADYVRCGCIYIYDEITQTIKRDMTIKLTIYTAFNSHYKFTALIAYKQ